MHYVQDVQWYYHCHRCGRLKPSSARGRAAPCATPCRRYDMKKTLISKVWCLTFWHKCVVVKSPVNRLKSITKEHDLRALVTLFLLFLLFSAPAMAFELYSVQKGCSEYNGEKHPSAEKAMPRTAVEFWCKCLDAELPRSVSLGDRSTLGMFIARYFAPTFYLDGTERGRAIFEMIMGKKKSYNNYEPLDDWVYVNDLIDKYENIYNLCRSKGISRSLGFFPIDIGG